MVNIKFRSVDNPHAIAFIDTSRDLETIYIPPHTKKSVQRQFEDAYDLSPKQAEMAADVYLEEFYPEVLAHEATHLALARLANEEGKPLNIYASGSHNPITEMEEDYMLSRAIDKALNRAWGEYAEIWRDALNG